MNKINLLLSLKVLYVVGMIFGIVNAFFFSNTLEQFTLNMVILFISTIVILIVEGIKYNNLLN
jgi:hypothetical protein